MCLSIHSRENLNDSGGGGAAGLSSLAILLIDEVLERFGDPGGDSVGLGVLNPKTFRSWDHRLPTIAAGLESSSGIFGRFL